MAEAFFTEVPERIRFGGLTSTEPLAYKVYDPDRLVLGKRMEDHLRPGVCFWHSFAWAGVDMFGVGTLDRPWLAGSVDPMDGARTKMAVAFEFFDEDRDPVLLLPRPGRRARRRELRGVPGRPRCAERRRRRLPGADRRPVAVGDGQPVHPSALPGRRRHQPGPRGVRLRGRAGQAHARGDAAPRRRELRPVGRPRGLRHAPEHGPRARGCPARPVPAPRRGAQAPHRVRRPAPDRAEADGADQAPVRLRRVDRLRLPRPHTGSRTSIASTSRRTTRRWPATASTTRSRSPPPTGSSAASTPTGATRRTAGTPTSSRTRSRTSRCRSTRSSGPVASRPAASTSMPSSAARAPIGPTCSTPTSAALDTLAQALLVAADLIERGRLAEMREARYAGLGRRARERDPRRLRDAGVARGEGRVRRDRSAARVGPARSCWRTWSTSRSGAADRGARSSRPPVAEGGPRPRHRRLDDGDQGRPRRRDRRGPRGRASPSTASDAPRPLWSEQDPAAWWDGAVGGDRRPCWRPRASRARTSTRSG